MKLNGNALNAKKRRHISYMVMQDVNHQLFSDSVWGECRISAPDAPDEKIAEVLDRLQLLSFRERHPMALSGGQKQRLCIARAMLRKPAVLILDDSTSAVDSATEAAIRQSFASNLKDTTVIIIAQRISSVQYADEVLILDDGRIAHEQLLAGNAIYQEIYQSQQEGVGG